MIQLDEALNSGRMSVLISTAIALGVFHTITGPDHYVPFVMMAKAQSWSRLRTMIVTLCCGFGHVVSSVIIGLTLGWSGMMFSQWGTSGWFGWHVARGSLSAWLLIVLGATMLFWGIVCVFRTSSHRCHTRSEELDSDSGQSREDISATSQHRSVVRITPWILFTIFVFGPCESLIPLMLASWNETGLLGSLLIASVFSLATIVTILIVVMLLSAGVSRISFGKMNRWSTSLAGLSLLLCGAAIQWLGL